MWGRMTIQTKIGLELVTCALLIVLGMSIPNYLGSRLSLLEEGKKNILDKVVELTTTLQALHELTQNQVNSDIEIMLNEIQKLGAPSLDSGNTIPIALGGTEKVNLPALRFGERVMNGDTEFVDKIKRMVGGGTVTIFEVQPGKLIRVSTNVLTLDGSRATGTFIPEDSPVYKAVMDGQTYRGQAFVVNANYLTAYIPLKDVSGKIVSVIYVGRKILNDQVMKVLDKAQLFGKGYAYLFAADGTFLFHPDKEYVLKKKKLGDIDLDLNTFLVSSPRLVEYTYKGQNKVVGVNVFDEKLGWRVAIGLPEDELLANLGSRLSTYIIIGAVLAVIVALVFSWLIVRGAMRPINALGQAAMEVIKGNYRVTIPYAADDTLGRTIRHFMTMVARLEEKIKESEDKTCIAAEEAQRTQDALNQAQQARTQGERARVEGLHQAAETMSTVVTTIDDISRELFNEITRASRNADEQRSRAQKTAQSTSQMNSTILGVAQSASQAAENAEETKQEAQAGSRVVEDSMNAIRTVQTLAGSLKEDMSYLTSQAESIGQVMNVINDIADQTNLLALNAAIEAARAGEAGRGFAVVADEVRKLAEKTMGATKEVGDRIKAIQNSARKNNENVDAAVRAVELATDLAMKSGEALRKIVELTESTADKVRNIATASEQQSAASEQISRAVDEVNVISDETSQVMSAAADEVQRLGDQTKALGNLIQDFRNA